jgi:tetratricopeptide (TPR) repeat protein
MGDASNGRSAASVTDLELQFAQNPESSVYVDLCEAYLDQGRFMEAMVVCKKGIKAHPDAVEARVLLSKVYARQKKYKRALDELDDLATSKPKDPAVFIARGRVRDESGDAKGAVDDWKKAVDLDGKHSEAAKLLAQKGITYPEPEPEPEPPPAKPTSGVSRFGPPTDPGIKGPPPPPPTTDDVDSADIVVARAPSSATPRSSPRVPISSPSGPPPVTLRGRDVQERAASFAQVDPHVRFVPQKLEGEEELEEIARKVAEQSQKEDRGKPKTTLLLLAGMAILAVVIIVSVTLNKRKVEAIDTLTSESLRAFNRDTYGSYKAASAALEEIRDDWDDEHALTLGRLAHTYAILYGEHGESELLTKLVEAVNQAQKHAPAVSHTIAAQGLAALYSGENRQASAKAAFDAIDPVVRKLEAEGAAPTHADLTLGIIEMHLGLYDEATKRLGRVAEVLPGSVSAKVWFGRAAYRAKRYGTAQNAFDAALRAEPSHPGALANLALVHVERGLLGAAGEDLLKFDDFAAKHPKEISRPDAALAEYARSEVFRGAGEEDQANGAYAQAVRLDPRNADFPYGLGRWLLENGKPQEALAPLKKAVSMEPNRLAFLIELAEAHMQSPDREFGAAEKLINDALAKAPDRSEPPLAKARLLRRKKDERAEEYMKGLLKTKPLAKVQIHAELGRLYRGLGRMDEAKAAFVESIQGMDSYPPSEQAEVLVSYGRLLEDTGDPATAYNSFEQAASFGSLEGSFKVASILAKSSRPEDRTKAKAACARVLAAGATTYQQQAMSICQGL